MHQWRGHKWIPSWNCWEEQWGRLPSAGCNKTWSHTQLIKHIPQQRSHHLLLMLQMTEKLFVPHKSHLTRKFLRRAPSLMDFENSPSRAREWFWWYQLAFEALHSLAQLGSWGGRVRIWKLNFHILCWKLFSGEQTPIWGGMYWSNSQTVPLYSMLLNGQSEYISWKVKCGNSLSVRPWNVWYLGISCWIKTREK